MLVLSCSGSFYFIYRCVGSKYSLPVGSVRVDFESLPNDHLVAKELPFGVTDTDAQMVRLNDTLVSNTGLDKSDIQMNKSHSSR